MGSKQSTEQGKTGKAYVSPVVLPPNMLHSSASTSTINSDDTDHAPSSSSGSPLDADKDMLNCLLQSYDYRAMLGKGSSAQVFEVVNKATGKAYACKVVRKNRSFNDDRTMSTETEIMKRMKHEHVLQLHELYETATSRWFVLELANAGSLQQALALEENYSETTVSGAFKQILEGVQYLHGLGIVHRDLKQDNILCSVSKTEDGVREYSVKIADFGLSAVLDVKSTNSFQKTEKKMKSFRKLKEMWGTKEYFAPEVYQKAYGPQADVWSLGCVLYELLTGETPFPVRERPVSMVERYLLSTGPKMKRYFELRPAWQTLSMEARDLISRMLKVNPRKRLSVQECLQHPFITGEAMVPVGGSGSLKVAPASSMFALASSVQAPVAAVVTMPIERTDKVLVQAREMANKMVQQRERKLQFMMTQLEKERGAH